MIALSTGKANVESQGDRIIVSIPSGSDRVEIAMTINEALHLGHMAVLVAKRAVDQNTGRAEPETSILPFKRPKRRKR